MRQTEIYTTEYRIAKNYYYFAESEYNKLKTK